MDISYSPGEFVAINFWDKNSFDYEKELKIYLQNKNETTFDKNMFSDKANKQKYILIKKCDSDNVNNLEFLLNPLITKIAKRSLISSDTKFKWFNSNQSNQLNQPNQPKPKNIWLDLLCKAKNAYGNIIVLKTTEFLFKSISAFTTKTNLLADKTDNPKFICLEICLKANENPFKLSQSYLKNIFSRSNDDKQSSFIETIKNLYSKIAMCPKLNLVITITQKTSLYLTINDHSGELIVRSNVVSNKAKLKSYNDLLKRDHKNIFQILLDAKHCCYSELLKLKLEVNDYKVTNVSPSFLRCSKHCCNNFLLDRYPDLSKGVINFYSDRLENVLFSVHWFDNTIFRFFLFVTPNRKQHDQHDLNSFGLCLEKNVVVIDWSSFSCFELKGVTDTKLVPLINVKISDLLHDNSFIKVLDNNDLNICFYLFKNGFSRRGVSFSVNGLSKLDIITANKSKANSASNNIETTFEYNKKKITLVVTKNMKCSVSLSHCISLSILSLYKDKHKIEFISSTDFNIIFSKNHVKFHFGNIVHSEIVEDIFGVINTFHLTEKLVTEVTNVLLKSSERGKYVLKSFSYQHVEIDVRRKSSCSFSSTNSNNSDSNFSSVETIGSKQQEI